MKRTIPSHVDSTGKLLERLALVARSAVRQRGRVVRTPPRELYVSPSVMRSFRCAVGCTSCCLAFTLDFTPSEFHTMQWADDVDAQARDQFSVRLIEVNGKQHEVYTYEQYLDDSCPYLRPTRPDALGCGFWSESNSTQPMECAAAPQLLMTTRGEGVTMIMKRPFGRGWAWQTAPECEFEPVVKRREDIPDTYDLSNEIMLLRRYQHWAEHLGIATYIPEIIDVMLDLPDRLQRSNLVSVRVI